MCEKLLLFVGSLLAFNMAFATEVSDKRPVSIAVFTTGIYPVISSVPEDGLEIELFDIQDAENLEKRLSVGLPPTEVTARWKINQMIDKEGREHFERRIVRAYQPLMKAIEFRVDRVPAIVFDQKAVVYGVTDMRYAYRMYLEWLHDGGHHEDE